MSAGVLVAGIGNIFMGDDGFGSEVARRYAAVGAALPGVRVVDYGIRGMHLAYDLLEGYDALVLLDALPARGPDDRPGALSVLEIGPEDLGAGDFDPHGMSPVAVLASLASLGGKLPPTYLVGCFPATVDDNLGLSDAVAAVIDDAVALTTHLVESLLVAGGDGECASESQVR